MMRSRKRNSFVAVLCIVIIIAYASVVFIPHAHECIGADCSVCALIETSRNSLIGIALIGAVWQLSNIAFVIPNTHYFIFSGNNGTPVSLKVKLSN
jgi:predicted metal-binding membrane protein